MWLGGFSASDSSTSECAPHKLSLQTAVSGKTIRRALCVMSSRNITFMNRLNGVVTFANGGRLFTSIPPLTLCRDLGITENTITQMCSMFFLTFRQIKPLHHSKKKNRLPSKCACVSDPRHKGNPIYLDNLAALFQQTHSF